MSADMMRMQQELMMRHAAAAAQAEAAAQLVRASFLLLTATGSSTFVGDRTRPNKDEALS